MAQPELVIEVVNPGALQRDRDYIAKRNQYKDIGIPEYWIVNPQECTILVLEWLDGGYGEGTVLCGCDLISSSNLGDLSLTVAQPFILDSNK